jgi:hypothetical protein
MTTASAGSVSASLASDEDDEDAEESVRSEVVFKSFAAEVAPVVEGAAETIGAADEVLT